MPLRARSQHVNPLLGIYFGIFVASLVGIVTLLLIFEQLGVVEARLRQVLTLGSLGVYAAIGIAAFSNGPAEFLLAGRRVPPFFSGIVMAISALGGTGIVAFAGAIFLIGLDAMCVPIGIVAGFVAMALLIAPFFRKLGAATVPGFFGMRFQSPMARTAAAVACAAPLLLLLLAEMKVAVLAASWLLDVPETLLIALVASALVLTTAPGGARSLAWSGAAQSITAVIAVLAPAMIVAVIVTNLPLGQLSHGPVLRAVGRSELAQGLPVALASGLMFEYPGVDALTVSGRFATPFGNVSPIAYTLATLLVMAGIAASPALLGRAATTSGIYDTRKSIGWSVLIAGVLVMTLSSIAVFQRDILMHQITGATPASAPNGLKTLIDLGFASLEAGATRLSPTTLAFKRDGVLLGLPILMGLPAALIFLVAAGVLAAALAAGGAALVQLGLILSEDVIGGEASTLGATASPTSRLMVARAAIALTATIVAIGALVSRRDPLDLVLWSLALTAGGLFPALLLSIWWKRLGAVGATASMVAGFASTTVTLVLSVAGLLPLPPELSALIGLPVAFATAIVTTMMMPMPERAMLEVVRDLRIPGGEPIVDREARIARQKRIQRTGR